MEKAIHWSGGHPWILQELGVRLATQSKDEGKRVTLQLFQQTCTEIEDHENFHFIIENDYGKLNSEQKLVLPLIHKFYFFNQFPY